MLKDRLAKARKEKKLSREKLAELAGVSTSTITFLENGRNESSKYLVEIATALGVSAEWLKDGEEAIIPISSLRPKESNITNEEMMGLDPWDDTTPLQPYEVEVPFLKDLLLSAGNGCFELADYEGRKVRFSRKTLRDLGVDPVNVFGFTVDGTSMSPVLPNGCAAFADKGNKTIKDGSIYAINNEGLLQVKVLKWRSGSEIAIESFNPDYETEVKPVSEIQVLGKIFWYSVLLS